MSLCNKKLQQMLESYPMYWNKRAALEFGVGLSEDAAVEAGMEQYFQKYVKMLLFLVGTMIGTKSNSRIYREQCGKKKQ